MARIGVERATKIYLERHHEAKDKIHRLSLWDPEKSIGEIARDMGVTNSTVYLMSRTYDLPKHKLHSKDLPPHYAKGSIGTAMWNLYQATYTQTEIARLFGVSRQMVNMIIKEKQKCIMKCKKDIPIPPEGEDEKSS